MMVRLISNVFFLLCSGLVMGQSYTPEAPQMNAGALLSIGLEYGVDDLDMNPGFLKKHRVKSVFRLDVHKEAFEAYMRGGKVDTSMCEEKDLFHINRDGQVTKCISYKFQDTISFDYNEDGRCVKKEKRNAEDGELNVVTYTYPEQKLVGYLETTKYGWGVDSTERELLPIGQGIYLLLRKELVKKEVQFGGVVMMPTLSEKDRTLLYAEVDKAKVRFEGWKHSENVQLYYYSSGLPVRFEMIDTSSGKVDYGSEVTFKDRVPIEDVGFNGDYERLTFDESGRVVAQVGTMTWMFGEETYYNYFYEDGLLNNVKHALRKMGSNEESWFSCDLYLYEFYD